MSVVKEEVLKNLVPKSLAVINMVLAVDLFIAGYLRPRQGASIFAPPEILVAYWINAPVTLVWRFLIGVINRISAPVNFEINVHLMLVIYVDCFVFLTGLLWYFASLSIASKGKPVLGSPSTAPALRIFVDAMLMLFGLVIGLVGSADRTAPHISISEPNIWGFVHDLLHLSWVLVFLWIGGKDLLKYVAAQKSRPSTT